MRIGEILVEEWNYKFLLNFFITAQNVIGFQLRLPN